VPVGHVFDEWLLVWVLGADVGGGYLVWIVYVCRLSHFDVGARWVGC